LDARVSTRRVFMHERTILSATAMSVVFFSAMVLGCGSSSTGSSTQNSVTHDDGGADGTVEDGQTTVVVEAAAGPDAVAESAAPPDTGSAVDTGLTCTPSATADGCDVCTALSCCAESNACNGEVTDAAQTPCNDIQDCVDACNTANDSGSSGNLAACMVTCTQPYAGSAAATDYNALAACQTARCAAECN
jgi:hypothetical protein